MLITLTPEESAPGNVRKMARRAAILFAAEGWTWFDSPNPPSAARIEVVILELVRGMKARGSSIYGSGRITVEKDELTNGGVSVSLQLGSLSGDEFDAL